jgi:plastocyanin
MRRTTKLRLLLLPALLLGLLLLAGCGGGSGRNTTSTTAPSTSAQPGTTGGAGAGVQVEMRGIQYAPRRLTVRVGQQITWVNEDAVRHDVQSTAGEKIASPLFGKGASFSFTPTQAGAIAYLCSVHPGMDGTIVVTK